MYAVLETTNDKLLKYDHLLQFNGLSKHNKRWITVGAVS